MLPLTMLITFSWNSLWGEEHRLLLSCWQSLPSLEGNLPGYLDLHGWRKYQGWPGMMWMTLFLCTADQRNSCVCSEYSWHQPPIITIFCIFIGESQSTVRCWELNTKPEVMLLIEEHRVTYLWVYFAPIYS